MSILDDESILIARLDDEAHIKYIKENILKSKEGEDCSVEKLKNGDFELCSFKQIKLNEKLPVSIEIITTPTLSIYGPGGLSNIQNKQIILNGKNYACNGYFMNNNIENKKAATSLYLNTGDTDEEIKDLNITSNINNSSGICYLECFNKFKRFINCQFLMGNAVPSECNETQIDQINNCIIDLTHTKIEDWNCFDGLTIHTKNKYTRVYINITGTPLASKTLKEFKDKNININEYYKINIFPHLKYIDGLSNIILKINHNCFQRWESSKWKADKFIYHLINYPRNHSLSDYLLVSNFKEQGALYVPNIFLGYELNSITKINDEWKYFSCDNLDLMTMRVRKKISN